MSASKTGVYVSAARAWLFNSATPASWDTSLATDLGECGSAKLVSIANSIEVGATWENGIEFGNSRYLGTNATFEAVFLDFSKALWDFCALGKMGAGNYYGPAASTAIKPGHLIPDALKRPLLIKPIAATEPAIVLLRPIVISSGVFQYSSNPKTNAQDAMMISVVTETDADLGAAFYHGDLGEFPTHGA